MLDAALLAAALSSYVWFLRGGPFGPALLARRRFARLALRTAASFGCVALVALALLDRLGALLAMPAAFEPVAAVARRWLPGVADPRSLRMMALGLFAGGALSVAWARWRRRPPFTLGDVEAVLPQSRRELGGALLLALNAGWTEELFFRLLLPLLLTALTGSAWAGFGVATALFGWAHRYQGWIGVAATGAVGLLLATVYLASAELWLAIALHMAIDLNALVLRPIAFGVWRRR